MTLDDVARRLAEPMGRRRAIGVIGGAVAGTALGGLWPRRASAQYGDCLPGSSVCRPGPPNNVCCNDATQDCINDEVHICRDKPTPCPSGTTHCGGKYDFSCCEEGFECKDSVCVPGCPPETSRCGQTCCGKTQLCQDGRCVKRCPSDRVRCGSKCCPKPDRGRVVCGQLNAQCCVESPPRVFCSACSNSATKGRAAAFRTGPPYFCGAFEKTCAERSDREYHGDLGNCVRVLRADPTAPPRASNAYYFHPCFLDTRMAHTKRLMRCDRVPDHTVCEGGECQADSLTCCHYSGGRSATQRSARAAAVVRALDKLEDFDEPVASSAGRVSRAELRRRIRLAEPRLAKTRRRLFAAQELPLTDAAQRKEIVAACNAHRRELLRLRRSVAAGRGGRPQRLLIKSYDTTARALLIYRDALAISNSPKSLPILAEAGEVGARANRYAAQALRALKL